MLEGLGPDWGIWRSVQRPDYASGRSWGRCHRARTAHLEAVRDCRALHHPERFLDQHEVQKVANVTETTTIFATGAQVGFGREALRGSNVDLIYSLEISWAKHFFPAPNECVASWWVGSTAVTAHFKVNYTIIIKASREISLCDYSTSLLEIPANSEHE